MSNKFYRHKLTILYCPDPYPGVRLGLRIGYFNSLGALSGFADQRARVEFFLQFATGGARSQLNRVRQVVGMAIKQIRSQK